MATRSLTPLEAAQLVVNVLVVPKSDIDSARIWTKQGIRVYLEEDGSPIGYLEILAGNGMKAIGGDVRDRPSVQRLLKPAMKDVVVAIPPASELTMGQAADRIASELVRLGYQARVWSKKGMRVYVDRDGEELGYLAIGATVDNRSKLSKRQVDAVCARSLGGARMAPPVDPNQRRAMLDAIRDAPEDDGPRLVYADWLQTHGDPVQRARGELIVAQLHGKDSAHYLAENGDRWHGALLPKQAEWTYERGMVEAIRASIHDLGNALGRILAVEPVVRRLRITSWGSEWSRAHHEAMGFAAAWSTGFAKIAPHFGGIEHLECVGHDITPSVLELARSVQAGRLRYLDIHEAKVDEAAIVALAKSTTLNALAVLDLRGNPISAVAAEALLATKLPRLRTVRFGKAADRKLGVALKARFGA